MREAFGKLNSMGRILKPFCLGDMEARAIVTTNDNEILKDESHKERMVPMIACGVMAS